MLPAENTSAFGGVKRRLSFVLGIGFATSKACTLRPRQSTLHARQAADVPPAVSI